jgi:hypothetical protein
MKAFKMADDLQAKQLLLSLNQLQKISDKTLLAEFDKDALDELRLVEQELRRRLEVQRLQQLYTAQMQGEAQKISTKAQIEAQEAMTRAQMKLQQEQMGQQQQQQMDAMQQQAGAQQAAQPQPQQVNVIDLAEAYAKRLGSMEPPEASAALGQMQQQMPQLHQLVAQKLAVRQALEQRPLPEQRPPRGAGASI